VFGRYLLMPLIGWENFAAMTHWGKLIHNFLSFPFVVGIVVMLVIWVHNNLPARGDWMWLKQGGGFFTRNNVHLQSGRFNLGQKLIFWSVILFGAVISLTGYVLMFPLSLTDVNGMQIMQIVHAAAAGILIAIIIAHIYTGTAGVEGSFSAMGSGKVDVNWARQHHGLWLEEQETKSREAAARGARIQAAGDD
jgi:formate dehydrogenase subunit gamma